VDSFGVAGNIMTVVVAILGVFALIRTLQPRPIIIAVASAVVLWGLGQYLNGLVWYEAILWSVLLYAVTYILFGLVARIVWFPAAVITAIVTAAVIRILLVL
jgi:apolipoprotein N-acyltransferase